MTATPLPVVPRSSSGFLKPVFSALQRRALRTGIVFGSVFLIGLVAIGWQIYHLIPAATLQGVLATNGVVMAFGVAFLWIAIALATTIAAAMIFVRQHVSGPAAELARTHEAIARGDLSGGYNPGASNGAADRLSQSTMSMITELRSVAGRMRESSQSNDALASQLFRASVSAAASARESAATTSSLSQDALARERAIREVTN